MQHESEGDELFCEDFNGQNSLTYMVFLLDFIDGLDKKYVFIFDNASYHKTDLIKGYLAKYQGRILANILSRIESNRNLLENNKT
ncbi:MAG: hypothetical protein U9Q69_01290 [Nanoarchaeota archaeon]|nr:hypothetical protein [Nanoarchaeota archaeon]